MVVPPNTPKWSFLVGKPMVVGYHHFGKHPHTCQSIDFHHFFHDADPCALPEEFGLGDDVAQGDTRRRTFLGCSWKDESFFRHNKRGVELYTIIINNHSSAIHICDLKLREYIWSLLSSVFFPDSCCILKTLYTNYHMGLVYIYHTFTYIYIVDFLMVN